MIRSDVELWLYLGENPEYARQTASFTEGYCPRATVGCLHGAAFFPQDVPTGEPTRLAEAAEAENIAAWRRNLAEYLNAQAS